MAILIPGKLEELRADVMLRGVKMREGEEQVNIITICLKVLKDTGGAPVDEEAENVGNSCGVAWSLPFHYC